MQTMTHCDAILDRRVPARPVTAHLRKLLQRHRRARGVRATAEPAGGSPSGPQSGRTPRTPLSNRFAPESRRRTLASLTLAALAPLAIAALSALASSPAAALPGFGCLLIVVVSALVGGL